MSSTLHGLTTIRAYRAEQEFADKFDVYQNRHSSVCFSQIVAMRWFGMVIQFLAFIYFLLVTSSFMLFKSGKKPIGYNNSVINRCQKRPIERSQRYGTW